MVTAFVPEIHCYRVHVMPSLFHMDVWRSADDSNRDPAVCDDGFNVTYRGWTRFVNVQGLLLNMWNPACYSFHTASRPMGLESWLGKHKHENKRRWVGGLSLYVPGLYPYPLGWKPCRLTKRSISQGKPEISRTLSSNHNTLQSPESKET